MPDIRRPFVHQAELELAPGCDPAAVGAAYSGNGNPSVVAPPATVEHKAIDYIGAWQH
jgi:hypothetical protein